MKNLCLLISMLVLLIPAEIKAQEKKESIVTIEMYATRGSSETFYGGRNVPFVIITIDDKLNETEKSYDRSKQISHVLEFRKEIDFWANKGYRLLSIETTTNAVGTYFYFFATMVKEE
jgi:hypothetical protein